VIDIVRDYTAIGIGSTQATANRVVGTVHAGVDRVGTWGHPEQASDPTETHRGLVGSVVHAPGALVVHVQRQIDGMVERLGLVSEAEVRALRQQVQRLERHISDLRGDR
jgi:polyhydroxyalkanoate synthesis regulator phasin